MRFSSGLLARAVVLLSVIVLAACGGGGDAPDGLSVAFDANVVAATFVHSQQKNVNADRDADAVFTFTVRGLLENAAYVYVVDSGGVFSGFPVSVVQLEPQRYAVTLRADASKPVGTYRGTLELRVCKDLQCSAEYRVHNGCVDYAITIEPQMAVEVYVDDVLQGTDTSGNYVPVNLGGMAERQLRILSNVSVVVEAESVPGAYVFALDAASTATDWRAALSVVSGAINGTYLYVRPQDAAATGERPITIFVQF